MGDWPGPKCRRQAVIICLWDCIELVIVTTGTFHGHRQKGCSCRVDHILQTLVLIFERIVGFVIPSSQTQETRGNYRRFAAIGNLVAGKLIDDKLVVRHIVIERINDPIAVAPGILFHRIAFIAIRLSEANEIQPMPRPSLTKLL